MQHINVGNTARFINNVTNTTHPTAHEKNFSHESGQSIHSTSELGVLSVVTYQLEDLSYNLFLRTYTSICKLRQHRIGRGLKGRGQVNHAYWVGR